MVVVTHMSLRDIRKRLIDLDLSEARLAAALGVSRQMLHLVLHGQLVTPWLRRAVAERLGWTYRAMWGEDDPGTMRGVRAARRTSKHLHPASVAPISVGDER